MYLRPVGYIAIILLAVVMIPIVFLVFGRRAGKGGEGEIPVGKPVMRSEPSADEPTLDASSVRRDTTEAQRHTPAA